MKKTLFVLILTAAFVTGATFARADDKTYKFAEPNHSGELKMEEFDENVWMLSIETANAKGNTCELGGYECVLQGSTYECQLHGGDGPNLPLVMKIQPDKSIIVAAAKKGQSLENDFCGMGAQISGRYKPAK